MTMRDYFGSTLKLEAYYRHPRNYNRRGIYSLDEPSATVRGVNRPVPPGYKIHPNDVPVKDLSEVRSLTTNERAQIQTFPADFQWVGGKTAREQMIGNAVPVSLATFIGDALNRFLLNGSENLDNTLPLDLEQSVLMPTKSLDKGLEACVTYIPSLQTKRTERVKKF